MQNSHLRLVSSSTSTGNDFATIIGDFKPTGIIHPNGQPIYVTGVGTSEGGAGNGGANPPSGNGGDDMKTPFEKLKQNVDALNKVVGGAIVLSLGAFVGLFFILDDRIADRFDNADKQIATVTEQISDLRVEATKQDAKLDKILESVNAPNTQPSP